MQGDTYKEPAYKWLCANDHVQGFSYGKSRHKNRYTRMITQGLLCKDRTRELYMRAARKSHIAGIVCKLHTQNSAFKIMGELA